MDFGYATSVDDIFDTPAKDEHWADDYYPATGGILPLCVPFQ